MILCIGIILIGWDEYKMIRQGNNLVGVGVRTSKNELLKRIREMKAKRLSCPKTSNK